MQLTPKLPPGRANRKALAFSSEIHRLRASGYSFEAIRLALLDAGVNVSRTTVKREAARRLVVAPIAPQGPGSPPMPALGPSTVTPEQATTAHPPRVAARFIGDSRSGREIAAEFMKDRISNPLIRERMEDEARRD